ncbi:MAG: ATP-dependent helicase/nuclease subunit [Aliidongia sp.]|nr:ATP-dependent helicase/nuclease subunit [Aliidongia sp.]
MTVPSVWTIPAALPFLDTLVAGIYARQGRDPLALAEITLLLPTRRACRAARDAFLRTAAGAPMLLPRLAALGDIDADELELQAPLDLPPAIPALRRQLLLAQLIGRWGRGRILPGQAVALADELGRLLDQAHAEAVPFDQLERLVPAELAAHWQVTVDFLRIVTEYWPAMLEAEGAVDAADRRNRVIAAQVDAWRAQPPGIVIAAGFAGAGPEAARLLTLISLLPQGFVVLPGVDTAADEALWPAILEDPTHPQHGLAQLLARMGVSHDALRPWAGEAAGRAVLAREMMRPASVSQHWRALPVLPEVAVDGLHRLDLPGAQEEATAVALLLRQVLETPEATGMLVTPDRGLARRVAAELRRWNIEIDDSAGVPLNQTAPGTLLRLIAEAAAERLAPVPLLALLKHPLADPALRDKVRHLERQVLRGPRPAPGMAGLRAAAPEHAALIGRLEAVLSPFLDLIEAPEIGLAAALEAHIRAAEALAGADRLWAKEAGESLAEFAAELAAAAQDFPPLSGADYPVLFEALLAGRVVRPRFGLHPRLQILGTLEARLLHADLVVLGGLNEGVWPPETPHDPWLSRPMRRDFGLPAPEAQIGLTAHDFTLGFHAGKVVLTRAARAEGAPTVPSRWLLRLDTVLKAAGLALAPHPTAGLAELLDRPAEIRPAQPPEPRPPVALRPRKLSVTEIETWMRDPYAIYARHILRLEALDPLDADPGVAERGVFIHRALDGFVAHAPSGDPLATLLEIGRTAFGEALDRPGVWAFWWPRFERIARWFVEIEADRRALIERSWTERKGRLLLPGPAGDFELTAKADRIDLFEEAGLVVIDYKTGRVPSKDEVALGFSPQLPLEAAIAQAGGFAEVPAAPVIALSFWRLDGGDPAGEIIEACKEPTVLAAEAQAGLIGLIARFDDPATPYLARPRPNHAPRYSPYGHLARLLEWGDEGEV